MEIEIVQKQGRALMDKEKSFFGFPTRITWDRERGTPIQAKPSTIKKMAALSPAGGTVVLPAGTGKSVRVLVIAAGDKAREAEAAGADFVGTEYIAKIKENWLDFDVLIATPDQMGQLGQLGRILGPRGLMPNPKAGTVTFDVTRAVREVKAGKIEYRVDKAGNVHAAIGKLSFAPEALEQNFTAFMDQIVRSKPASTKGVYIRNVAISSTMGPGVSIDTTPYR